MISTTECPVCYETKSLFTVCENNHKLCSDCFLTISRMEQEQEPRCPCCRSLDFGFHHTFREYQELGEIYCQVYFDPRDTRFRTHTYWKFENGLLLDVGFSNNSGVCMTLGQNVFEPAYEAHLESLIENGELDEDDVDDYECPMSDVFVNGERYETNNIEYIITYDEDGDDNNDPFHLLLEMHFSN